MAAPTKADLLLAQVLQKLGLSALADEDKYSRIVDILAELQKINSQSTISAGTTGAISERLCEYGLKRLCKKFPKVGYRRVGSNWQWLGDFLVNGHPYDVAVSVKSFKARERLLVSGTGSALSPTIGWGLFNDPSEWSTDRIRSYLFRGFIAIYMPLKTLDALSTEAREIENFNGRRLVRGIDRFPDDLIAATSPSSRDRVQLRRL